jgi:class 3 adenylate cyclase
MSTEKLDPSILDKYLAITSAQNSDDWDEEETIIGDLFLSETAIPETGLRLEGMGFSHLLGLSPVLLGRDAGCTLSLNSKTVSRYHMAIYKFGKHYRVRDLHSTNGILLNHTKVNQAVIRAKDVLQLGDQSFQIHNGPPLEDNYSRECVVVFLDLAESTRLVERYGDAFNQFIQTEISKLEDRILIHRGFPIKHLGDGLMCAFGLAPPEAKGLSAPDQALAFAWEAVRSFRQITAYPDLKLRVGLHLGEVYFSEQESLDIFGDSVNLASRLEYCNKEYGTQIMVSQNLYQQTQRCRPFLREVDSVRVAGKEEPVTIFYWDENSQKPGAESTYQAYYQALQLYRQGAFPQARSCLASPQLSQDKLAQNLLHRLDQLPEIAPNDWTGIWQLEKNV